MTDSEHPAEKTAEVDIDRASMTVSQYLAGRDIAARGVEIGPDASRASSHLETEPARKYDVGKFVARGGMGMILSAKDRCIRRHVAMKVMTAKYPPTGDQILRFIEEGQVTGQLEHPNIVPVHELGVDAKGHVFYTMKMVRGHTLKDVLGGLRSGDPDTLCDYSLMHLLSIFQRICDGVAFAHSRGVIHRDLKPENIMLGDFGEVLVMDWGLAKVRGLGT